MTMPTLWEHIRNVTNWLDHHNGIGEDELTLRTMKIGEEFGEVVSAWIGMKGQNPRKGTTHTEVEVMDELCDVVLAALVAMESLAGDAERDVMRRVSWRAQRLSEMRGEENS